MSIFRKSSPRVIALVPIFVFALAVNGCRKSRQIPRTRFVSSSRNRLNANLETNAIKKSIASSYSDGKGFNKQRLSALQLQFLRRSSIHLLTRILNINVDENGTEADVSVLVAMAGTAVDSLDALKGLRANLMRFQFRLIKDGEWFVTSSHWNRAKLSDFLRTAVQNVGKTS